MYLTHSEIHEDGRTGTHYWETEDMMIVPEKFTKRTSGTGERWVDSTYHFRVDVHVGNDEAGFRQSCEIQACFRVSRGLDDAQERADAMCALWEARKTDPVWEYAQRFLRYRPRKIILNRNEPHRDDTVFSYIEVYFDGQMVIATAPPGMSSEDHPLLITLPVRPELGITCPVTFPNASAFLAFDDRRRGASA